MDGFFPATSLAQPRPEPSLVPRCAACRLYLHCQSPKMPVSGKGKQGVLVIGEAPGETEDAHNQPFIGRSGQLLQKTLTGLGVNLFEDCWVTNSLICRPHTREGKNRTPTDGEIRYCRPNVRRVLEECKPSVIILLGAVPVKSVLGWLWRDNTGPLGRWVGWRIPSQRLNAWICPTYHPAHVLREQEKREEVLTRIWTGHLRRALVKVGKRPWKEVPDYAAQVEIIHDPTQAARRLPLFVNRQRPVAFDYETTTLKPESDAAQIVSCAVSDGKTTVAYPWAGAAVVATRKLLWSGTPMVASNLKFEERWTLKEFGQGVKHWHHDTMLAAHVLDNRPGISGIKFQSLVLLGQDSWDDHLKEYLKSRGSNLPNRVRQIDRRSLLLYNGLDALLEIKVARIQRKQLGLCRNK